MAQKRTSQKQNKMKNLPGLYPLRLVSAHRSGMSHVGVLFEGGKGGGVYKFSPGWYCGSVEVK